MSHVTKNYNTDGGDRTVIGGVLEINGGKVIKDGQEVTLGGDGSNIRVTHEMLDDKSVRSNNIGTGSVMEEHLNSTILKRFTDIEAKLKELEGSSGTE
ncbi:hypothetical protein OIO07_07730 [Bacillus paralicheniformis]|jgi:hypothetical protein|uniref:Uncharacterized protein n=1 Tax=Bacillus paralicheniformis TaxID=1648923 RepID=A0AAW6KCE1_9BACI|nr:MULTISPECIES: hypothetical protein [Bacillus subtilis group]KUL16085.1 hypothetical protein LI6934_17155 [Bacillus licheniformis LMG 6934]AYQ17355.1 hypothetical protein D5285_15390 [Bacillus paralicheniformis]MBW7635515.1 hypothetical protein [Bacillus licheniformis]MCR3888042.1 hypothetical protein [Bacillus paralicheniformis]MCV9368161.1 hypothetical protein [Bacillus paralicheniformis]